MYEASAEVRAAVPGGGSGGVPMTGPGPTPAPRRVPRLLAGLISLVTLTLTTLSGGGVASAQTSAGHSGGGTRSHIPEFIVTPLVPGPAGTTVDTLPPSPLPAGANAQEASGKFRAVYTARVPEVAKPAVQSALDRWAAALRITIPVEVAIDWLPTAGDSLVGAAKPTVAISDFPAAPLARTFYPVALANQLTGVDQAPSSSDIEIILADRNDWDYATAGSVSPNRFSLTSVVLHEVVHGLGFSDLLEVDTAGVGRRTGSMGFPSIFDTFVADSSGNPVLGLPDNSVALGNALTQGLSWRGVQGTAANGGALPVLFSPSPYVEGSSVAHLDEVTYPTGHPDSVSTPLIVGNEAIYSVGTIAPAMLVDLGWMLQSALPSPSVPVPLPATPPLPVPATPPIAVPASAPIPVPGVSTPIPVPGVSTPIPVPGVSAPVVGAFDPSLAPATASPSAGALPATNTLPRTGFPTGVAAMLGALAVAGGMALVQRSRWSPPVSRMAPAGSTRSSLSG